MKAIEKKLAAALLAIGALLSPKPAQPQSAAEANLTSANGLSTQAIVEKLIDHNQRRNQLLAGWEVRRRYHLKNEIYEKEVERVVDVTFRAPDQLEFDKVREKGPDFLADRVFGRMMEGEEESLQAETKRRSAMTPENYEFRALGQEELDGRRTYVLKVTPRREATFVFEGKIWVDAEDFAVIRAQGSPAERPSFWTRQIEFVRTFKKVGPFWLPDRTESVTEVWLFGTTWTTIDNSDYKVRLRSETPAGSS